MSQTGSEDKAAQQPGGENSGVSRVGTASRFSNARHQSPHVLTMRDTHWWCIWGSIPT